MNITVPFIYEALIIKPRCRKPSLATIKDTVTVEINEFSKEDLPVAFKVGDSHIRWDGCSLWNYYYNTSGKTPQVVTGDTIKNNTEDENSKHHYSYANSEAPFANFWRHGNITDTMSLRHNVRLHGMQKHINESGVVNIEDVQYREWIDDNKDAVIKKAKEIAEGLRLLDGLLIQRVGEPRYVITTFGLGNNHGGTGMFIQPYFNSNIHHENYFNALEFDKASEYANMVATRRGDNKSVPVKVNCGNIIEVLIPEAVKCNPNEQHGTGCDFINKIEQGINSAGPAGGILAAVTEISNH